MAYVRHRHFPTVGGGIHARECRFPTPVVDIHARDRHFPIVGGGIHARECHFPTPVIDIHARDRHAPIVGGIRHEHYHRPPGPPGQKTQNR